MLDTSVHSLSGLFAQLGLPNSQKDIDSFIDKHRPIPQAEPLSKADFWNESQASFLREAILANADWAEVVDELNLLLRD
jgi:hypothetical protein